MLIAVTDRSQLLRLYKVYCAADSSMCSWLGSLPRGQSGPMLLPSSLKLCPLPGPGSPCHSAHLFLNHTGLKATSLHISSVRASHTAPPRGERSWEMQSLAGPPLPSITSTLNGTMDCSGVSAKQAICISSQCPLPLKI